METPQPANPSGSSRPRWEEFDEEGYLQLYPDIARGVHTGAIESGWAHFCRDGFAEGRAWVPQTDPFSGVSQEIAPGDEMFAGNGRHYFEVGADALRGIDAALGMARTSRAAIHRVLDLPCGYGRVMRFLRKTFPAAELTACDLDRNGVAFCAQTFGAVPVPSSVNPEDIPLVPGFDLIWCGSLLTHLPEAEGARFLARFHTLLRPGGLAVITTHGRHGRKEMTSGRNLYGMTPAQIARISESFQTTGRGYVDYAGQTGYGLCLYQPAYLVAHHFQHPGWRLISYLEAGWDGRQDVICLQKRLEDMAP